MLESPVMDAVSFFGARLRELRKSAGMTQDSLAVASGLSLGAIRHWERGDRKPSWGDVVTLAATLGVSCEAFLTPPEETEPPARGRPRSDG